MAAPGVAENIMGSCFRELESLSPQFSRMCVTVFLLWESTRP